MPTFKDYIAGRTAESAIVDADEFYVRDDSGDTDKRITYAGLKTALDGVYAPLVYAQAGSGAPNGAVTGSVGDRYVDTAATLGARVWYKATGTATDTGWLVAEGDTGYRDVSATLTNGWALASGGYIRIRRVNDRVAFTARLSAASATSNNLYAIPAGFRPTGTTSATQSREVIPTNASVASFTTATTSTFSVITHYAATLTGTDYTFSGSWTTDDEWPSALPGSAYP